MHWDKSKMGFVGHGGVLKRNPKTGTWVFTKDGQSHDLGPNKDVALAYFTSAEDVKRGKATINENNSRAGFLRWLASAMD